MHGVFICQRDVGCWYLFRNERSVLAEKVKRGEERERGRRRGGGKKRAADTMQLALSIVNEPRCFRDKERVCERSYPLQFP